MMIGAASVGKTAYWLYPNFEYACASGMSFMTTTDTKGDLMRNYGNNLLHLVNKYVYLYVSTGELQYKVKTEKYFKIISKTIILSGMEFCDSLLVSGTKSKLGRSVLAVRAKDRHGFINVQIDGKACYRRLGEERIHQDRATIPQKRGKKLVALHDT